MPSRGDKAPRFILRDENGESVDSEMLAGLRYILFSFDGEGADEVCSAYMSVYPSLAIRNIILFGISRRSWQENSRLRSSLGIKEKLLSDPEGAAALKPGDAVLVGKDGTIKETWENAPVKKVLEGTLAHFRQE